MGTTVSQITIVYSSVYSGADQRKRQSSASLAFVRGIHPWMFPFDDVIMIQNMHKVTIKYISQWWHTFSKAVRDISQMNSKEYGWNISHKKYD